MTTSGSWNDADFFYASQMGRASTTLATAFLDPNNIAWLLQQLNAQLSHQFQQPVTLVFCDEQYNRMVVLLDQNRALPPTPNMLRLLNLHFLNDEYQLQALSLRQSQLFRRYFVTEERMRVFPLGTVEHAPRGQYQIVGSGYMLSNPHGKRFAEFKQQVLHMPAANSLASLTAPASASASAPASMLASAPPVAAQSCGGMVRIS